MNTINTTKAKDETLGLAAIKAWAKGAATPVLPAARTLTVKSALKAGIRGGSNVLL